MKKGQKEKMAAVKKKKKMRDGVDELHCGD